MKTKVERITIEQGQTIQRVIFRGTRRPMTQRVLYQALEPLFRAWIRAAVSWKGAAIGDYRFVVFAVNVSPKAHAYVQFWSEPGEPVLVEVSSGRWNKHLAKWLGAERVERIRAFGFGLGRGLQNFQREVTIESPSDVYTLAREVADIFWTAFDYRGTAPVHVQLTHESRAELAPTLDSFTPEDVAKLLSIAGFRVDQGTAKAESGDETPVLRCVKHGIASVVAFDDRVKKQNLYRRASFSAELMVPTSELEPGSFDPDATEEGTVESTASTVHAFDGGVTAQWLLNRIAEWDLMLKVTRAKVRRLRRTPAAAAANTVVH
jgi:hypothetical protein